MPLADTNTTPLEINQRVIRRGLGEKEPAIRRGVVVDRKQPIISRQTRQPVEDFFTYTVCWDDGETRSGYLRIGLEREPLAFGGGVVGL